MDLAGGTVIGRVSEKVGEANPKCTGGAEIGKYAPSVHCIAMRRRHTVESGVRGLVAVNGRRWWDVMLGGEVGRSVLNGTVYDQFALDVFGGLTGKPRSYPL